MQPHISYLICATNRSGSFLLCEALKNTGVAGQPEEYFWRNDEPFWKERWGVSSYADYVAGAITQGDSLEEARENLKDAIEILLEANRELALNARRRAKVTREKIKVSVA